MWSYVIAHHDKDPDPEKQFFAIHEVFMNDDGGPWGITKEPISPFGETKEELIKCLNMMLKDAENMDIIPLSKWDEIEQPMDGEEEFYADMDEIEKRIANGEDLPDGWEDLGDLLDETDGESS